MDLGELENVEYHPERLDWMFTVVTAILGAVLLYGLTYVALQPYRHLFLKSSAEQKIQNLQTNPNYRTFSSKDLGVEFTYAAIDDDINAGAVQVGNKIYVYNTKYPKEQGQSIEVFQKDPELTLKEAIAKQFLQGYDSRDCFVIDSTIGGFTDTKDLSNYVAAQISFPETGNNDGPWWENNKNCPENYSQTNAVQYFLMNKNVPDRFLFVALGQAPVTYNGIDPMIDWSNSLRIVPLQENQNKFAGWKSYKNDKYGLEFQYPGELFNVISVYPINGQTECRLFGNTMTGEYRLPIFEGGVFENSTPMMKMWILCGQNILSWDKNFLSSLIEKKIGNRRGYTSIPLKYTGDAPPVETYTYYVQIGSDVLVINTSYIGELPEILSTFTFTK